MVVIAIETSGDVCSVALLKHGNVVRESHTDLPRRHAEQLVPMIRDLLDSEGISRSSVGFVAVSAGPGSYTGLRIGASTAKGLAFALDAKLLAVSTLEALAIGVYAHIPNAIGRPVVIAAPSRKNEVYAAIFKHLGPFSVRRLANDQALELDRFPSWISSHKLESAMLSGPAADIARSSIRLEIDTSLPQLESVVCKPSAAYVAMAAVRLVEQGACENISSFEPTYLKAVEVRRRRGSAFDRLPF